MTDTKNPTATLTPWDRQALAGVLARMPYLPLVPTAGRMTRPEDVAELIVLLGGLADVLTRYSQQAAADAEELANLRADVAAARRLLGLPLPAAGEYATGRVRPARDYEAPNGGL